MPSVLLLGGNKIRGQAAVTYSQRSLAAMQTQSQGHVEEYWALHARAAPEGWGEPLQQNSLTAQRGPGGMRRALTAGSIWEKTEMGHLDTGNHTSWGCNDSVIIITVFSLFYSQTVHSRELGWSLKLIVKHSGCNMAAKRWTVVLAFCFLNTECKRWNSVPDAFHIYFV